MSLTLFSQNEDLNYTRLPDKCYLHLDRNLYSPGDTIWFKAYVFHRNNLQLSDNSYALHIQILNQEGDEISSHKMLLVDGMGYGQIPVQDWMEPGLYQIIAHSAYMKNFGTRFFQRSSIEIRPRESHFSIKTYFDQPYYQVGDTAHVTFFAYDEFQMPVPKKRFRYNLVHQDESLIKGGLRCYDDGRVRYSFPLTKGSKAQPPVLHLSYYDENIADEIYEQEVAVPMADQELMLEFYPEGGHLLQGVDCRIAFEATDALGQPVDVEGVLMQDSTEILRVKSMHQGIGYFTMRPQNSDYRFKVFKPEGVETVFTLPKAQKEAYSISYVKRDKERLYLLLSHNFSQEQDVELWLSQYDHLQKIYKLKIANKRLISMPLADLPKGLFTATLLDEQKRPAAERLMYNPAGEKALEIHTDEDIYGLRKKVNVTMALPETSSKAHLSVAVVDSVLAHSPWLSQTSIKADALLKTELRGNIDNLDAYLRDDKASEINLNLLIMTHGWRRYNWIFNQQQLDSMRVFDFNSINGKVMRGKKPAGNAQMTALVLSGSFAAAEFLTDKEGRFSITPKYESRDGQKILFQAKSDKDRRNVKITLHNNDTVLFAKSIVRYQEDLKAKKMEMGRYVMMENDTEDETPFFSYESKLLQELVVYGERVEETADNEISEAVTAFATGVMKGEDLIGGYSFADFVEQVSFRAQYAPSTNRIIVRSRGGGTSLDSDAEDEFADSDEIGAEIYVNNILWGKDVSQLDFLTQDDIAQIVVLDPEAAFASYGSDGQYGVILVATYDLKVEEKQNLNRNMAVFGRFIDSKEFYQPKYETKAQDSMIVVDNRITLHWEPFLETDSSRLASFDFYTDDISGTKQIVVQGLDEDGILFYETKEFEVKGVGK